MKMKKILFSFGILVILSVFLSACTKQPLDQGQIHAEAELLAKDKGMDIKRAIKTVGKAYMGQGSNIIWLNCSDSDATSQYPDGKNYDISGTLTVTYYYIGEEKILTYLTPDKCSRDNTILNENYCQDNRFSKSYHTCSYKCLNGACIAQTTGSIYAISSPSGANLYIDNVYKGTTPTTLSGINVGNIKVKFTLSGYKDYTIITYVFAGQTTPVPVTLEPI